MPGSNCPADRHRSASPNLFFGRNRVHVYHPRAAAVSRGFLPCGCKTARFAPASSTHGRDVAAATCFLVEIWSGRRVRAFDPNLARPSQISRSSIRPISIPSPSSSPQTNARSSIVRRRLLSIGRQFETHGIRHGVESRDIDQAHDTAASVTGNGASRRQHDLRDGAAWRVSATLRALATMCRMGFERSGGMAHLATVRAHHPRATSRCYATALSAGESAGSSSKSGIDGGMRTGTYFRPATHESMMFDHSCIMCRRCTSYSASL